MVPGAQDPPSLLSSSPRSLRTPSKSPVRHQTSSARSHVSNLEDGVTYSAAPRHSTTFSRSFSRQDSDVRERQRTMDADMAFQLSRARRDTVSQRASGSSPVRGRSSEEGMSPYPQFGTQPDLDYTGRPRSVSELEFLDGESHRIIPVVDDHDARSHLSRSPHDRLDPIHDPNVLVSLSSSPHINVGVDPVEAEIDHLMGGLPMYQPTSFQQYQSKFDFSTMEEYAKEEMAKIGAASQTHTHSDADMRKYLSPVEGLFSGQMSEPGTSVPFSLPPRQTRERKLSISKPVKRRGKMALFEQSVNAGVLSSLGGTARMRRLAQISIPSAVPEGSFQTTLENPSFLSTGHDRAYRFSFYSNSLAATIHSRSLAELPAEGQSFEDLFSGIGADSEFHNKRGVPIPTSGTTTPRMNGKVEIPDLSFRMGFLPKESRHADGEDAEFSTWWLDVTSPTDEEMKMLSKVFSIHPLTTEDIQMEETREKIELFRNYYFVCFRSFDQDPHSPTYLEPLNMYVVVFREGTLSFHFRPTPHPQNVRRRIKQLKDYINVTSDWISYALIDDITDAFGPLIQSIEYEVDSIDELVLILKDSEQSDMLRRIGTCRKKVMGLLRLMGNKADVVKGLAKRCNENWRVAPTSDIGLYLSDIQDHLITMTQSLNHYEKILSRSHSNYLAQISIEMTDANNQINDVLSKLTALGTVLIPMNLITGLWGMNVHVPGQEATGYAWFFSIIACLCAIAMIGGYSTYKLVASRQ